ncbi:cGMP-dependent protein kinase 2-like [Bufo gargarizans]|uniref:cGMP-dependent protein kinase 2-like n=1 Tax=Bufo gargarizans TaxID=30331 RepID=UPI001CF5AE9E|nr:cGMP-dependent protein kinase 2-like [Bufo gargarizans]
MYNQNSMGNGTIRAPRREDSCLSSRRREHSSGAFTKLQETVLLLEEELRQRWKELQEKDEKIRQLEKELETKSIQIDKLQDAIGYNVQLSPKGSQRKKLLSVINQGPAQNNEKATDTHRRQKAKEGVSAEPTSRHYYNPSCQNPDVTCIRKDSSAKKLITGAIMSNDFLSQLEASHVRRMVDCMYERVYSQSQLVIQEGAAGNHLYVLAEGLLDVIQNSRLLGQMHPGTAFGELAILYNCKRTATVKAVTDSKIWVLDRQVFQNIMMSSAQAQHQEYFSFLRSVSLLKDLPEEKLSKIIDCLEIDFYDKGDYIIREGEEGNTFFIIAKGKVCVTQAVEGSQEPQEIKTLGVGDYFGEKALISEDVRSANIIAEEDDTQCLVIDRDTFNQMVGTYQELQTYLREYVYQLALNDHDRRNARKKSLHHSISRDNSEVNQLREVVSRFSSTSPFRYLDVITTLGTGGFGRVELVKLKDEDLTFALKCIKKKHIVDTHQQEHVYWEKNILQQINCSFIIRLYRTFRDAKYVYMLLEVCLGGELWTILRDTGSFEEGTARFCIGCVLEAYDYLHNRGIVYRDLKPENLLLDSEGYIKMVDFGFAKKIGAGKKTWTFCGTPEYVAPEIIMNRGHDFGADYWSLGILIYELLTGSPPFSGTDPIKIYNMVLKGIEKVDFPHRIGRRSEDLIRRLCRINPAERLGNRKNGISDIRKHKWFQGFNWEGLRNRKLLSPLKREIKGITDHSFFDNFLPEAEDPPDELSGWDKNF